MIFYQKKSQTNTSYNNYLKIFHHKKGNYLKVFYHKKENYLKIFQEEQFKLINRQVQGKRIFV